jgi:hypothetical protein
MIARGIRKATAWSHRVRYYTTVVAVVGGALAWEGFRRLSQGKPRWH